MKFLFKMDSAGMLLHLNHCMSQHISSSNSSDMLGSRDVKLTPCLGLDPNRGTSCCGSSSGESSTSCFRTNDDGRSSGLVTNGAVLAQPFLTSPLLPAISNRTWIL